MFSPRMTNLNCFQANPAAWESVNALRSYILRATWKRLAPFINVLSTSKNAASPACFCAMSFFAASF
ncbi:hypothetical protein D3C87_2123370 [compost metagenome]